MNAYFTTLNSVCKRFIKFEYDNVTQLNHRKMHSDIENIKIEYAQHNTIPL